VVLVHADVLVFPVRRSRHIDKVNLTSMPEVVRHDRLNQADLLRLGCLSDTVRTHFDENVALILRYIGISVVKKIVRVQNVDIVSYAWNMV
jgi:hypothetical protein